MTAATPAATQTDTATIPAAAPAGHHIPAPPHPAGGDGPAGTPPGGRRAVAARVVAGLVVRLVAVLAAVSVVVLVAGLGEYLNTGRPVGMASGLASGMASGGVSGVVASVAQGALMPAQGPAGVLAQPGGGSSGISLSQFLTNARDLVVGLLATVAIFFLSVGFLRLLAARGETDEVAKGKEAIKHGVYGFLGVMLTPAIIGVLQSLTGGGRGGG